ncbi:MAG: histidinol dehydrogenase [Dehalococcoidia bacterium]|nr:histidinol dehydrogenase [Dehalococcoidia bacterium]
MRVLHGLEEARAFAAARTSITSQEIPEELAKAVLLRSQAVWGSPLTVPESVRRIIEDIRKGGDAALRDLTEHIDGIRFADLEVPKKALAQAAESIPTDLRAALELAAQRVAKFAEVSLPKTWHDPNTGLGELIVPLERVGLYAPGGTAAYPSTVIMSAVTARTAGVQEVIVCSPAHDGVNASAVVLAAAHIAGVDRVFRIGGAQAIAAMAFGTESVPKVDKICGPGNIFVALAKQQLFGQVGIDGVFGPTETVVVADDSADPALCAADLLAQAEHDVLASAVLITPSEALVSRVGDELVKQLMTLERRDIALASLNNHGAMILVGNLAEALDVSNLIAPEHLCLMVKQPRRWVKRVRHAGGLFLGEHSAEVMGDYVAGPSHTIPTHGTARFASYLGVDQFIKRIPVIALKPDVARRLAPAAAIIARAEGFTGHARAADLRAAPKE